MSFHPLQPLRRAPIAALVAILLAACTLNTAPAPAPAPSASPAPLAAGEVIVAWAERGELYTWRSADPLPRRIASGGVIRPFLAPDGQTVAYLRGPHGDPRALWIADTQGATERQLIDAPALPVGDPTRRIGQVLWAPEGDALYFTTLTGTGIATRPAEDLWRVDVLTGTGEALLPDGQAGQIALSPGGERIALATAGRYGAEGAPDRMSGQIALYDVASRTRQVLLDYPAVATGSEWRWYPALRWLPDGSGLRAAIPPPDLIYGDAGGTVLWALPVEGAAAELGRVDADFFGLPVFSADGAWIAFMGRRTAPDQPDLALMIARADGSEAVAYAQGAIGALGPATWLPGAAQFSYQAGAPGALWIGGPGGEAQRFPAVDVPVLALVWADARTFVIGTQDDAGLWLASSALDNPAALTEIARLTEVPTLDAVWR